MALTLHSMQYGGSFGGAQSGAGSGTMDGRDNLCPGRVMRHVTDPG